MPIDLTDREWPERVRGIGVNLRHRAYVNEGQMIAMSLGFTEMYEPIPADEAYVTALAVDDRQVVYGGTGGRRAHLFAGLTRGLSGAVVDMAVLQENARTTSVAVTRGGDVLAATAPGRPLPAPQPPGRRPSGEGAIFGHEPSGTGGDLIHEWHFSKVPAEKLTVPLPEEGIADAVLAEAEPGRELLVGIGERTGTLFTYDPAAEETEVVGPVDEHELFSPTLTVGPDGRVYGGAALGELWSFDPADGRLEKTGLEIPSQAGREVRNHVDSFAVDSDRGLIYGGGTADGVLFAFDPAAATVRSIGKPTCNRGIKGLTVTNDGRLFGVSGRKTEIAHLFCYDPGTHQLRDLGLIASVLQERVYGYEFSCGAAGEDGQIFFGESERGGHLWIYWPAIKAPNQPSDSDGRSE
ncbi:MAG: hypothetical protein ACOC7T_04185 [Planctomycetota bacterium]